VSWKKKTVMGRDTGKEEKDNKEEENVHELKMC